MRLLPSCLDCGISELDFWNMTIGELIRAVESKNRVDKLRLKEKATFDYLLAMLIGANVGRHLSNSVEVPTIEEIYSFVFEDKAKQKEEEKQALKNELSALRFKQYADFHNKKYTNGGAEAK